MEEQDIVIETDTSASENAASLAALSVETGLALSVEVKAQNEELRAWLSQQLSMSQESLAGVRTDLLSSRETLQTILERLNEMQETQEEFLSLNQVQEIESSEPGETIIVVDPLTAAESETVSDQSTNPSEKEEDGHPDTSSAPASKKKRRVQPL